MKIPFFNRKKAPPEGYLDISKIEYTPDNGLQVLASHPSFLLFIDDVMEVFFQSGAENVFSLCAWHPKAGEVEIVVQRKAGKTQGEIINELRTEIAELKKELDG